MPGFGGKGANTFIFMREGLIWNENSRMARLKKTNSVSPNVNHFTNSDNSFLMVFEGNDEMSQSSGLRNSSPIRLMSEAVCWRLTLAIMGGVSGGTAVEVAGDGAGMVKLTTWPSAK